MDDKIEKLWMTPAEAAAMMKVSPVTLRAWSQRGLLEADITPGGHRRYSREVMERFRRTWNPNSNKGPIRILIVDDDPSLLGFLAEFLGDQGNKTIVETAMNGFDAGQKLLTFRPDVVLMDQMMPGMKGTEVCRRIKELPGNAPIRVLAMSGYLTPEVEQDLLDAGAERCFAKPLDTALLLKVIGIEA